MKMSKVRRVFTSPAFIFGLTGLVLFVFLTFVVGSSWIHSSLQEKCRTTQRRYSGDCVVALLAEVQDEEATFHDRNDAIWALGQIGDERALPLLESMYTGDEQRTKYDQSLSQYGLGKAIRLLQGGFNLTRLVRPPVEL